MARTAALATLLNVWRVDDPHVRRCVASERALAPVCDAVVGVLVDEFGSLAARANRGDVARGAENALVDVLRRRGVFSFLGRRAVVHAASSMP